MMPTLYTEESLALYLHDLMATSGLAKALKWAMPTSAALGVYAEVVNDTCAILGLASVGLATGTPALLRLRAVAKAYQWRRVLMALVTQYAVTLAGNSFQRQQMMASAIQQSEAADNEAASYGVTLPPAAGRVTMPAARVGRISYSDDPYRRS